MPDSVRDLRDPQLENSDRSLVWTVHLVRREPGKFVLSMLACFAAGVVGYASFKNPFPVLITLAVLLTSISDFLLPVTYRIGPKGASSTSLLSRRVVHWDKVKACYLDESGVKLSTISGPSRREAFQGVYLRFSGNRDEVVQAVRKLKNCSDD